MKVSIDKEIDFPLLPPRGWKKRVAAIAGCSEKTVYNALRGNIKGPKANKVVDAYRKLCKDIIELE